MKAAILFSVLMFSGAVLAQTRLWQCSAVGTGSDRYAHSIHGEIVHEREDAVLSALTTCEYKLGGCYLEWCLDNSGTQAHRDDVPQLPNGSNVY